MRRGRIEPASSMAHSLEVRDPLLDHKLVEWAARLPQSLKANAADGKIILKTIASRLAPRQVVDRPKQGFGLPMDQWFRKNLGARLQQSIASNGSASHLDARRTGALLDEHRDGRRNRDRVLWTLMCYSDYAAAS